MSDTVPTDSLAAGFHQRHNWHMILRRGLLAGIVMGIVALLGMWLGPSIPAGEKWIESLGIWGPVLFVLIYVALVICLCPSNALAFACGAMFGFWVGYLSLGIGVLLAAPCQFVIGRYIARKKVEAMMAQHPKLAAIDDAVSQQGFKLMFLLRLAPIPFAPLSYGLAVSRVSFLPYMVALLGMFISNIAPVYYGFVANHVLKLAGHQEHEGWLHYVLMGGGIVVAIIVSAYVAHVARHAMARVNPAHPAHEIAKAGDGNAASKEKS